MDLQELITRGRFVFSKAPERLGVFGLVNGKRSAADIAKMLRRHVNNIHRDLKRLGDAELIQPRKGKDGELLKLEGFTIYEKSPLARTVPIAYFQGASNRWEGKRPREVMSPRKSNGKRPKGVPVPTETELLDICRDGEDQLYEFKAAATEARKLTREIAAMLNTKQGGIILYGVDDDGTIQGAGMRRQVLDQPLQNSVKNSISPAATVVLKSVSVVGSEVLVIIVPPWNRKDVYQFDEKVLIRKGTNVFAAKPEELKRLHKGEYVV